MSTSSRSTSGETPVVPLIGYKTHSPELYAEYGSKITKYFNIKALDRLQMCFDTGSGDGQQFLDIGCGIGDFTREELLPRCLPCKRLVATDVSGDMLEYAKEHFADPKIVYDFLDIGGDVSLFLKRYGQFQRVYSFFCLQWLNDKEVVMNNIRHLLAPGGECLLLFGIGDRFSKIWNLLREKEHWKGYNEVFEKFAPSVVAETDPLSYMSEVLYRKDLVPHTCEVIYEPPPAVRCMDDVIGMQLSVNPLVPHLSEQEKKDLSRDLAEIMRKQWITREEPTTAKPFLLLVHASKPKL